MSSGDVLLLDYADRHGLLTAEAAAVLLGTSANAAAKRLAGLVEDEKLEKWPFIRPRCIWTRYRKLGAQALRTRVSLLGFCVQSEARWEFERWDGPAAVCASGEKREAVFFDLGGTPDHVGRKLRDYCSDRKLEGITGLTVLTLSAPKAQKVYRAASGHRLPLPVRCVVIEDLRKLQ